MANGLLLNGADGIGRQTQSADTVITFLTGGLSNYYTHLTFLRYTSGGTAHTVTVMKAHSRSTLTAAAAASQAVIITAAALTDADGNAIAANDFVGIKKPDGSWHLGKVSSLANSNKTITLTANVPTGGFSSGAKVVCFGAAADTAHTAYTFYPGTSATTNFPAVDMLGSLMRASAVNEPLMLHSTNATAQGYFDSTCWGYAKG